jgi:SAM-dependent methyltransferase
MITAVQYACPHCHASLYERQLDVLCAGCGRTYPRLQSAYADFAGPESTFDDWWTQDSETTRHWLATRAPKEAAFQAGVARHFVLPLLSDLGNEPGQASLLSAACGVAADVDALNDAGFATWGIDCGSRVHCWSARHARQRLARASLLQLPFPDGSFDVVLAIDALEHIGVLGDTTHVAPDFAAQRQEAMRSLLRVTRPGGWLVLTGVNRRFPLDPFHTQDARWPSFIRVHSPWERFSLCYGDYARLSLATGVVDWIRPLPLRGFFSWTTLGRYSLLRPVLRMTNWLLGGLPPATYASWLSFFTAVLVHRRAETYPNRSLHGIA